MKYLLLILSACAGVPHVEPQPRELPDRLSTVVTVLSECDDEGTSRGAGVLISDRYVLTANHVVSCRETPSIHLYLRDGTHYLMTVARSNEKQDIAKLESLSSLGKVVPPLVSPAYYPTTEYDGLCTYTTHTEICGPRLGPNTFGGRLRAGDSGSPIYDEKYLVGLATRDDAFNNETIFTIVTQDWMEGT